MDDDAGDDELSEVERESLALLERLGLDIDRIRSTLPPASITTPAVATEELEPRDNTFPYRLVDLLNRELELRQEQDALAVRPPPPEPAPPATQRLPRRRHRPSRLRCIT